MRRYKNNLKNTLRNGITLSIIPQFLFVKWLANHPEWVEEYYSKGIYPFISQFFRSIFNSIPFSVGEIIYTLLIILGLRYLIWKRKKIIDQPLAFVRDVFMVLSIFYFTFHLVWGLNYYRKPLSKTLAINETISAAKIKKLTSELVTQTNRLHYKITSDSTKMVQVPYSRNEIIAITIAGYKNLEAEIPLFDYPHPNIKKSMFSSLSSYMGIGGYLNPFTNEAQVNRKTPVFRFPVVTGHEVGHQIGYSAENETNLIGYLVTAQNKDIYFQYSASAYALSYCLNAVYAIDEKASEELYQKINEGVKQNYQELKDFNEAYENPFEPIFESVFSMFLKANNQSDGIKSYSRVVNLLVGYHEKYPL